MSDGENARSLAGLWNRARRILPGTARPRDEAWDPAEGAIHATRTLVSFLQAVAPRSAPVVVDLGPAFGANVSFLGALLSCKLYPEDLYADFDKPFKPGEDALAAALAAKLRQEPGSVDGILAWDVFDYLERKEAAGLAAALLSLLRPGGVMMALFATEPRDVAWSRRYLIVDSRHLRHRPAPGARWPRRVWPLGDIEVVLAPLEVVQSHLMAHHQREMLLRRPLHIGKTG